MKKLLIAITAMLTLAATAMAEVKVAEAFSSHMVLQREIVFFKRTQSGLNFKSVGENPKAAATLGIDVIKTKYIACIVCGALAGIGGAYLTTCYSNTFTEGNVAGRGFIALAAVIFGRWSGGGVLVACIFFGLCDALQIRLQVAGLGVPYQFFQMIPYVATVVALTIIGGKKLGPKASGKPYRKEQR